MDPVLDSLKKIKLMDAEEVMNKWNLKAKGDTITVADEDRLQVCTGQGYDSWGFQDSKFTQVLLW